MDYWNVLIDRINVQLRLKLPSTLIVTDLNTDEKVSIFTIAARYADLDVFYREYLNIIPSVDVAMSWVATQIDLDAITKETERYKYLYEQVQQFLKRSSDIRFDSQTTFDREVRRYISLQTSGMPETQLDQLRAKIRMIESIRDFMAGEPEYKSPTDDTYYRFRTTSIDLEIPIRTPYPSGRSIDVFDSFVSSKRLPYVVHNGQKGKRTFKYFDDEKGVLLNIPIGWVEDTANEGTNSVVAKLYARDKLTKNEYNSKAAYTDLVYTDVNNSIKFEYIPKLSLPLPVLLNQVRKHVSPSIPLDMRDGKGIRISNVIGSFVIRGIKLDKVVFPDVLMNHPIISRFAYVNEDQKPLSTKKRVTMHIDMDPLLHIWVTFRPEKASQNEVATYRTGKATRFEKDEMYMAVQIRGMESEDMIPWAQSLVLKIFNIYNKAFPKISSAYQVALPKYKPTDIHAVVTQAVLERSKNRSKLEQLQYVDANLFIPGYASKVQSKSQPTWIPESQVEEYRAQGRQVIRVPAKITNSDLQFSDLSYYNYYVSTIKDKPYLGLVLNNKHNCKDYPYVLAAYKEKTLAVDPSNDWALTIKIPRIGKKSGGAKEYVLDVGKIMDPDRRGALRTRISLLLELDTNIAEKGNEFVRMGMPQSTSSLLHALHYAMTQTYATEDEIVALRRELSREQGKGNHPYLAVTKQERFDYTIDEIKADLEDVDGYVMDSALDYRLLEEYYNISLYVFSLNERNEEPILELPRHKYAHHHLYHNVQERPLVLLYKHTNKKSLDCGSLNLPIHYELIIQKGKKASIRTQYKDQKLTERIKGLMRYTSQSTELEIQQWPSTIITSTQNDGVVPLPPEVTNNVLHQMLDGAGRVVRISYTTGEIKNDFTTGTPPLNAPLLDVGVVGKPNYRKTAAIIQGILKTLTILYITSHQAKQGQQSMAMGVTIRPASDLEKRITIDTNIYYDSSKMNRIYPYFKSFEEAFHYFNRMMPSLFSTDDPKTFSFVADSERTRMGFQTTIRSVFQLNIPNYIEGYYVTAQDFTKYHRNQMILLDTNSMYSIMAYMQQRNNHLPDDALIHPMAQEPYLISNNGRIFVAQNVLLGDKARAMTVVDDWKNTRINGGFFTLARDPSTLIDIVDVGEYNPNVYVPNSAITRIGNKYMALLMT